MANKREGPMRFIITGGTGTIGRALASDLISEGHEVIVLSRNPAKGEDVLPPGTRIVGWDAKSSEGWVEWVEGATAIVNLAGARLAGPNPLKLRWTDERRNLICESRFLAGQAVSQAVEAVTKKPKVVIQASGINYYPTGDEIATEESQPGDGFLPHVCADCWEISTKPVEELGVRRVIIRTGPVLHPKSGPLPPMVLQSKLFLGGPLGNGRQWFSWIHLADVVGGIRFLIDHPEASGTFNLCAPNPLTNAGFSQVLGRVLRRPSILPVPSFALKLLYGEMASTLLTGVRAVPARLQTMGYPFRYPEAERALKDLLVSS
ncbi:MAG: TIGR01777 family oxidoreductase [Candidatus Hodarchaeota archaeon]